MKATVAMLMLFSLTSLWRDTSSHAASARGAKSYARQQYTAAVDAFRKAFAIAPSPQSSFNLGTAEIAAGQAEEGAAALNRAVGDPALRADALFNRGNAALAAKSFDRAVGDYVAALKAQPSHAAAKRNLEIALQRREEAQKKAGGGNRQQQGANQQQPQKPQMQPKPGQQQKPGEPDLDALLRSVQQQEREELRRMKGRNAPRRVGW